MQNGKLTAATCEEADEIDGLSSAVCAGCGLPGMHKMCVAYGTDAYMNSDHPAWGNVSAIVNLLVAKRQPSPEVIEGRGQAVTGIYAWQDRDEVFAATFSDGETLQPGMLYIRVADIPTFPPRPELTDEQIQAALDEAGIDMEPAYKRLRKMISDARAKKATGEPVKGT